MNIKRISSSVNGDSDSNFDDLDIFELDDAAGYGLKFEIRKPSLIPFLSDELLRGPVQELDLGSDEEIDLIPSKGRKSKQREHPSKIIPTGSDDSDADSDSDNSDGPTTMANMEARSRALDARHAAEAELDLAEAQVMSDDDGDDVDMDGDEDENGDVDGQPFRLPTATEKEEERANGGPDVHTVQRRMRECVRVLSNFKRLGEKGR